MINPPRQQHKGCMDDHQGRKDQAEKSDRERHNVVLLHQE